MGPCVYVLLYTTAVLTGSTSAINATSNGTTSSTLAQSSATLVVPLNSTVPPVVVLTGSTRAINATSHGTTSSTLTQSTATLAVPLNSTAPPVVVLTGSTRAINATSHGTTSSTLTQSTATLAVPLNSTAPPVAVLTGSTRAINATSHGTTRSTLAQSTATLAIPLNSTTPPVAVLTGSTSAINATSNGTTSSTLAQTSATLVVPLNHTATPVSVLTGSTSAINATSNGTTSSTLAQSSATLVVPLNHTATPVDVLTGSTSAINATSNSTTSSTLTQSNATLLVPLNSTVPPVVCKDEIDNCIYYGRYPCTEKVYQAWSKAHCAKYCGFCVPDTTNPAECRDKLPNCHEFDAGTLCTADSYSAWAYEYCKGYCKLGHCSDICQDRDNFDCQTVNQTLNLCAEKHKAKPVCQKYCDLCDMVDGQWSDWAAWEQCSVSCGNGTRSRSRLCNNPSPTDGGYPCVGSGTQHEPCTVSLCPVHGGWGSWGSWSTCSATCDNGLQHRHRICDSPRPARQGDHCFGSESEYQLCSLRKCGTSAFTATHPHEATVGSDLAFTTVVMNDGKDYNSTTGNFVCDIPGFYFFTLSLTKVRSSDDNINDQTGCYIRKNGNNQVRAHIDPSDQYADSGSYGTTASVTLKLTMGDVVSVGNCFSYSNMESWSLFSGFLVYPTH